MQPQLILSIIQKTKLKQKVAKIQMIKRNEVQRVCWENIDNYIEQDSVYKLSKQIQNMIIQQSILTLNYFYMT